MSIPCPKGYYCPEGTGLDWQACPRGTYSDVQGLYLESQCKPCTAGKYCGDEHLASVSGEETLLSLLLKLENTKYDIYKHSINIYLLLVLILLI